MQATQIERMSVIKAEFWRSCKMGPRRPMAVEGNKQRRVSRRDSTNRETLKITDLPRSLPSPPPSSGRSELPTRRLSTQTHPPRPPPRTSPSPLPPTQPSSLEARPAEEEDRKDPLRLPPRLFHPLPLPHHPPHRRPLQHLEEHPEALVEPDSVGVPRDLDGTELVRLHLGARG